MGQRFSSLVTADTTLVTTAETVIATISGVSTRGPGSKVTLVGNFAILLGTNTTAITPRWRRGTDATGVLIGEANAVQIDTAAGSTEEHTYSVEDSPGELVNATYVLTVAQTGASANGTVPQAEAWADTNP